MNGYSFYSSGEHFATCWTNEVAESHISACADLGRRGLTPYYCHSTIANEKHLLYADSFKREKLKNKKAEVITPDNIGTLSKSLQKQLSAFEYDGEEWKLKR